MNGLILCLVVLLSSSTYVFGVFFQIEEAEKKCFIVDIAEDTKVKGNVNINI